ncbi:MAG: preprotein translocase subunit SecG [Clostridium perfringens]|nr:preprotein translocase subunit SecG [Clostridium perfringens]
MRDILIVIEAILAIIIMISILVQPSKSDALSGFVPGNGDTFFAKNKGRTKESRLIKLTIVTSILFAICTIILNLNIFS